MGGKQVIKIRQRFHCPAKKVFNFLADHERLGTIWPGRFTRVKDGLGHEANGIDSVRQVRNSAFIIFEETITKFEPERLIEYRITKSSLIAKHWGQMVFIDLGNGCILDYHIEMYTKLAWLGPIVRIVTDLPVRAGIVKLAKLLA